MNKTGDVKFQYLAGIFANIVTISFGAYCGWPSSSFLELGSDASPLETGALSEQDQGNVASVISLGGLVGNVFFLWLADKIGRRRSLLLLAVPSLLGWIGIPLARNPTQLIAVRFIGGTAGGGCFGVIPIYTAELAEDSVRGILGTLLVLSCNLGVILAFVLGFYFNYATVAWIVSALSVVFVVCFWFMPETPQYLAQHHKLQEAEKALRYYRNIRSRASKELSEQLQLELHKLRAPEKAEEACADIDDTPVTWHDFANTKARKACFIGLGLVMANQACGCFAMLSYTALIFHMSGSSLPPAVCAIIVGVIQLVGSYVATLLVERAGRKLLLLISAVGICLSQVVMGCHSYVKVLGHDTNGFDWVPIAAFSFMLFIAAWGLLSLPFLVISEILPPKIRSTGNMLLMSLLWGLSVFMIKILPLMTAAWGMHGTVLLFACCSLCGAVFIAIFVPETKGKTIETILANL
ncbi:GH11266 [Drosophila grimshawi]|uniref:GH11266 n=2 Tax=Drosophila grimshawi TaxID=7222 RepID=B4JDX5_DROGR|nr:GH11266 [Drosophila grimshawi]